MHRMLQEVVWRVVQDGLYKIVINLKRKCLPNFSIIYFTAPNGCLQYYTGITDTINSFNYGTGANTLLSASLVTGTRQIANLNYGICIRMEAGYCAIQYAQVSYNRTNIILFHNGRNVYPKTQSPKVQSIERIILGVKFIWGVFAGEPW